MQKYEYKCVFIWGASNATTMTMNEYGRNGWEFVSSWWCWHYFKRPLEKSI